ncbi:centrosomal protein of 295 kDa-like [Dysidea avara]|uniref:centrosomal protein of 295 kDa-like n=1 Tax=Dysidea avara TaxID=196820 RepID=UPI00331DF86C
MSSLVQWKLSPNEEAERIRKEKESRRITRLLQVREQQKLFAKKLRNDVKRRKEEEKRLLENHLTAQHRAFCEDELDKLQDKCQKQLKMVGSGHVCAQDQNLSNKVSAKMKTLAAHQQRLTSEQRYREAMEELNINQAMETQVRNKPIIDRKKAIEVERSRAQKIAALPTPQPYDLVMDIHPHKGRRVTLQGVEGYASSYYHIPSSEIVQRTSPDDEQLDAHQSAAEEAVRRNVLQQVTTRQTTEHNEKARLRHKHAMARVKLERDQEKMVKELEQLMRQDRTQRRQQLSTMPPNLFQTVHRRREIGSEQQRDMEQAFEDLFVRCQGSGRGLDGIGREIPQRRAPTSAPQKVTNDSIQSATSSECPELSVEQMTSTTTTTNTADNSSSVSHHLPPDSSSTSSNVTSVVNDSTATAASNTSTASLKRLMEMVQLQRQAWEQQQQEAPPIVSSNSTSSKDTTTASDPASLSVATASSSWDTSNSVQNNKSVTTQDSSSTIRTTSPVHIPTVNNTSSTSDSTLLTETSHSTTDGHLEAANSSPSHQAHVSHPSSHETLASNHQVHISSPSHQVHMSSPSHQVHMSSPSHQVHMSIPTHQVHASHPTHETLASSHSHRVHTSNSSSSSSSEQPTPTDLVEVISSTNSFTSTEESSSSDEGHSDGEQPFSWENLSEVEDESAAAMTEPQQCDYDPVQFSVPISSHRHMSPPSLQDAFRQHKANFISSSQSRLQLIKEKRNEQAAASSAIKQLATPTKPSSTSRVVQFSSPLFTLQDTGEFTPPTIHRANSKVNRFSKFLSYGKIPAKQMKSRTQRLYNALPEVQQKKEAELRQQRNATNRERAHQFHQKLRQNQTRRKQGKL